MLSAWINSNGEFDECKKKKRNLKGVVFGSSSSEGMAVPQVRRRRKTFVDARTPRQSPYVPLIRTSREREEMSLAFGRKVGDVRARVHDRDVAAVVQELRQKWSVHGERFLTGWRYYTGEDGQEAGTIVVPALPSFAQECTVRLYIADMYTAMNPAFLARKGIHAVVNMLGSGGAGWRYSRDRSVDEWDPERREAAARELGPERRKAAERYKDGAHAFYGERGINDYVEEAAIDSESYSVKEHFSSICKQLADAIRRRRSACGSSTQKMEFRILFHCYAGCNRSASALLGFWYWYLVVGAGADKRRMHDLIVSLSEVRPVVLTQGKGFHWNFVRNLLEWEVFLDECWASKI